MQIFASLSKCIYIYIICLLFTWFYNAFCQRLAWSPSLQPLDCSGAILVFAGCTCDPEISSPKISQASSFGRPLWNQVKCWRRLSPKVLLTGLPKWSTHIMSKLLLPCSSFGANTQGIPGDAKCLLSELVNFPQSCRQHAWGSSKQDVLVELRTLGGCLGVMDRNHFERPAQLRVARESIEDGKWKGWRLNTNQGFSISGHQVQLPHQVTVNPNFPKTHQANI